MTYNQFQLFVVITAKASGRRCIIRMNRTSGVVKIKHSDWSNIRVWLAMRTTCGFILDDANVGNSRKTGSYGGLYGKRNKM